MSKIQILSFDFQVYLSFLLVTVTSYCTFNNKLLSLKGGCADFKYQSLSPGVGDRCERWLGLKMRKIWRCACRLTSIACSSTLIEASDSRLH